MAHIDVKMSALIEEHLCSGEESTDPDYLAWKERKILRALEQAKDRSCMIPAEEVWKDFGQ